MRSSRVATDSVCPSPPSCPARTSVRASSRAAARPASGAISSQVAGMRSGSWNIQSSTRRISRSGFRSMSSAHPDLSCRSSSRNDAIAANRSPNGGWVSSVDCRCDAGSPMTSASWARRAGSSRKHSKPAKRSRGRRRTAAAGSTYPSTKSSHPLLSSATLRSAAEVGRIPARSALCLSASSSWLRRTGRETATYTRP